MWKKEGNHLISKYDGNMLGVHETRGLVTLSEDDEMITPILIDENATSSFELSLSCMYCSLKEHIFHVRLRTKKVLSQKNLKKLDFLDEALFDKGALCTGCWELF